jgi:phosphotransferase system enzyme I (PtsI)
MFPMVAGLSDFIQAKSFLEQAKEELAYEGIAYRDDIEVGIMIEVPSAALTVDILARHVDFLSVGTNDLVQYITAADRMNPEVSNVYNPYHPAVIKVLREIVEKAHRYDCPVSVCGELAGDERYFPLFIALGIRELSMSPYFISRVKNIIRGMDEENCSNMIAEIMSMETAEQVEAVLRKRYHAKWQQCS